MKEKTWPLLNPPFISRKSAWKGCLSWSYNKRISESKPKKGAISAPFLGLSLPHHLSIIILYYHTIQLPQNALPYPCRFINPGVALLHISVNLKRLAGNPVHKEFIFRAGHHLFIHRYLTIHQSCQ